MLYVALTRAKEKLICVGAVKKCYDYLERLYSKLVFESIIEPYAITSCQSYCESFDYAKLLKKNLDFKYRNRDILSLPQKVSASDIAHSQNSDYFEKILSKPLFIAEKNSAPVARGTAHHKFLQYCSL